MSGRAMNKNILIFASLLALSACDYPAKQLPHNQAPLFGAQIGGSFNLIDQDGKPRSYDEFNGKYRIVYFGYTSCPDICTPDMQNLMAGLKLFEQSDPKLAAKIQPIFITVDPQRDTPEVLGQFVRAFHPRLLGLSGSPEQVAGAAKKFAVYFSRVEGSQPNDYLMSHSQMGYLMGPDGKPLALLPMENPKTPEAEGRPQAVVAELAKWVQ
jgi:protein SCO1